MIKFHRWGFEMGPLCVCWFDIWEGVYGLEVTWWDTTLIDWGFKR